MNTRGVRLAYISLVEQQSNAAIVAMKYSDYKEFNIRSQLTCHAATRQQQRGKKLKNLDIIYNNHDFSTTTFGCCEAIQISRKMIQELIAEGRSPQVVESASRTTLLISANGRIVTIYPSNSVYRTLRRRKTNGRYRFLTTNIRATSKRAD